MRRSAVAAIALLSASALVGCSGDPQPKFESAPTTSSAPTVTPTTDPPSSGSTPAVLTPERAVKAWVEGFNMLLVSGRAADFEALSTPECSPCAQLIAGIVDTYDRGGSTVSEGWAISRVAQAPDFGSSGHVVASIDAARGVTVPEAGAAPAAEPADKFIIQLTVIHRSNAWLVSDLAFLS